MIVREVLKHPELINNFDWFNDYRDTKNYLREVRTDESKKLLEDFDVAYNRWVKEELPKIMKRVIK